MSMELMASSERVCYVHCNHCNTILAVSVPAFNGPLAAATTTVVTVRCGHCANLLSVNIGAASVQYHSTSPSPTAAAYPHPHPHPHPHSQQYHSHPNIFTHQKQHQVSSEDYGSSSSSSTSSKCNKFAAAPAFDLSCTTVDQPRVVSPIRPPEKRQRVPSAYNRFIKEEIQRIKASNPDISHREAFSTAAKNWAHFPHIHFGLKLESNKHAKLDNQTFAGEGTQKSTNGFY
ncbi:putative axial regulator YABBY 2 [Argentina anserina]|uniref:putative axial regulator YABBY 2 n=1 Tax=Argentina anserina TaxID=57926 RepID=UPI002176745E|nr:putative axial regulator YABBY 2 [Potentilla anserina]